MNILLISRCPPYPLYLGDRLIVYHLAHELSKRGHVIDLLAFSDRLEDLGERDHYAAFFRHIHLIPEPKRTQMDYLKRLIFPVSRFPQSADQSWSPEMWQLIAQMRRENHYDVAHLFGGIQVYEYANATAGLGAIITPYESYSLYLSRILRTRHALSVKQIAQRIQWHIARAFERFMFTPYTRTVVVSERDQAELLSLNPALPVTVIPNGIDLDAFPIDNKLRESATLLFTGNYEYAPNVDAALTLARDIFPKVQARFPDATLQIVGNAPPPELMALNGGQITVTGRVPDLRPFMASATVFVSPLLLGAGIKNKILEALVLGCPVVATPLSVDGIQVENDVHAVIADTDNMVESVCRVIEDVELQKRLSINGRALIEAKYTWSMVAEQYERLFLDAAQVVR